jgi:hypothetical protein
LQAVASTAIAAGAILIPAEDGKGKTLPEPTASDQIYTMIGMARTSAAAHQLIKFMNCVPQQHVVNSC